MHQKIKLDDGEKTLAHGWRHGSSSMLITPAASVSHRWRHCKQLAINTIGTGLAIVPVAANGDALLRCAAMATSLP